MDLSNKNIFLKERGCIKKGDYMETTPKQKHTHKLKRHKYKNGEVIFFCVKNCNFRINQKLSLGKNCICWRCGNEFKINEYSIRMARPNCQDCTKSKKKVEEELKRTERIFDYIPLTTATTVGAKDEITKNLRDSLNKLPSSYLKGTSEEIL